MRELSRRFRNDSSHLNKLSPTWKNFEEEYGIFPGNWDEAKRIADRISVGNREKKSRRWEGRSLSRSGDAGYAGREVRPGRVKTCSIEGEKMGAHLMMPRCASHTVSLRHTPSAVTNRPDPGKNGLAVPNANLNRDARFHRPSSNSPNKSPVFHRETAPRKLEADRLPGI